jgi:hypothetical protein
MNTCPAGTDSSRASVVRGMGSVEGRASRSGSCCTALGGAVGCFSQQQDLTGLLGGGAGLESVGSSDGCSGQQQQLRLGVGGALSCFCACCGFEQQSARANKQHQPCGNARSKPLRMARDRGSTTPMLKLSSSPGQRSRQGYLDAMQTAPDVSSERCDGCLDEQRLAARPPVGVRDCLHLSPCVLVGGERGAG